MISRVRGITGGGRTELAQVLPSGDPFITPAAAAEILGVDAQVAAKKLARWASQGWVRRVRRGLYIGVPIQATNPGAWSEDSLLVAARVWSPCYFTGWTAARHWNLTEQVFRTTVLKSATRVRSSTVTLLDHDYLIGHVDDASMTWGLSTVWNGGTRLQFADPARTIVDVLDNPKLAGGIRHGAELLMAYLDEHDPNQLLDRADRLGNRTVFKRLGYLLEALGAGHPDLVSACHDRLSSGVSALDPDGPAGGRRVMRWHIRVNVEVAREEPS